MRFDSSLCDTIEERTMFEKRTIVIKTNKEAEVSVEELYELRKAAFQPSDISLLTSFAIRPIQLSFPLLLLQIFVASHERQ